MDTNESNSVLEPQAGFLKRWLFGFLDGHYIDRPACDAAFERMHRQDAIGDRIHLLFACLGLVCMFGPVTLTEVAFGPLVVFFFVRVINTFPVWIHGFGQPVALAAIAIAGWMMLSLRWSGDSFLGWGEIAELRWFVLVGLIFPVIEHRRTLITAMCLGIAFGQLGQVADAFDGFGIGWLAQLVENHPSRIAGWWQPVVGGSILVAGLGLHLPSAMFATGRARLWGMAGVASVGVGIIATGTRGAWIASVLMIVGAIFFGACTKRMRTKQVIVHILGALVISMIAGVVMRESLGIRIDQARTELGQAFDGQYDSSTGLRVKMGQLAIDATIAHPVAGVGAGGYQSWVNIQDPEAGVHAHAHNSLLQISSTLGLVGVLLWSVLMLSAIRATWRIWDRETEGYSGLAPLFALVGFLLASLTDSIQLNTQTAAMLGALVALCPAYRPKHPIWRSDK